MDVAAMCRFIRVVSVSLPGVSSRAPARGEGGGPGTPYIGINSADRGHLYTTEALDPLQEWDTQCCVVHVLSCVWCGCYPSRGLHGDGLAARAGYAHGYVWPWARKDKQWILFSFLVALALLLLLLFTSASASAPASVSPFAFAWSWRQCPCPCRLFLLSSSSSLFLFHVIVFSLYEPVCRPLSGKNSLIVTYGVTNSGKTYTMQGTVGDGGGVLPRTLDDLFAAIKPFHAKRGVFAPNRANGMVVQSQKKAEEARRIWRQENSSHGADDTFSGTLALDASVSVDGDCRYAIFVTFIEIYNEQVRLVDVVILYLAYLLPRARANGAAVSVFSHRQMPVAQVYDLLDVERQSSTLHPKKRRPKRTARDACGHTYVRNVTYKEVHSTAEAFEVLALGRANRRVAATTLNSHSSRSHSVFTIRLARAPLDESGAYVLREPRFVHVSECVLVDLAGSERTGRSQTSGHRLREASSINKSLMALGDCIKVGNRSLLAL